MDRPKLTEEDGRRALQGHVSDRALLARDRHGIPRNLEDMLSVLEDPEVVRYPVEVVFDDGPLLPGEFAHAAALSGQPSEGFRLFVHPYYRDRAEALPLLIAYHLVSINYGEVATFEEAELFGATLLGLDVDDYYRALCRLADELLSVGAGTFAV